MDIHKIHVDRMLTMSEEELNGRARSMQGLISRARSSREDSSPAEVELCYLQRELEIRDNRRVFHENWLRRRSGV